MPSSSSSAFPPLPYRHIPQLRVAVQCPAVVRAHHAGVTGAAHVVLHPALAQGGAAAERGGEGGRQQLAAVGCVAAQVKQVVGYNRRRPRAVQCRQASKTSSRPARGGAHRCGQVLSMQCTLPASSLRVRQVRGCRMGWHRQCQTILVFIGQQTTTVSLATVYACHSTCLPPALPPLPVPQRRIQDWRRTEKRGRRALT